MSGLVGRSWGSGPIKTPCLLWTGIKRKGYGLLPR